MNVPEEQRSPPTKLRLSKAVYVPCTATPSELMGPNQKRVAFLVAPSFANHIVVGPDNTIGSSKGMVLPNSGGFSWFDIDTIGTCVRDAWFISSPGGAQTAVLIEVVET